MTSCDRGAPARCLRKDFTKSLLIALKREIVGIR